MRTDYTVKIPYALRLSRGRFSPDVEEYGRRGRLKRDDVHRLGLLKEVRMLFAITWTNRGGASEDRDKRTLKLFKNWQPPAGLDFKGFYDYADGNGGIAIAEANSAEVILEATAPWATFLNFTVRPIVPTDKSPAILEKAMAWRDSVR